MAEWWYHTIYKCPGCGATRDEYDHTAPWCDSGMSTCPVIEQMCDECASDQLEEDEMPDNQIDEFIDEAMRATEVRRPAQYVITDEDRAEMDRIIEEDRERDWQEHYSRYCQQHSEQLPCGQCEQELLEERREEGFLD